MVLEKQDSGVCLSVEPASPTEGSMKDDPRAFRWSRTETGGRGTVSSSMNDLERVREARMTSTKRAGVGGAEGVDGEGRLRHPTDRVSDLTEEGDEAEGRDLRTEEEEEWKAEEERALVRCHHRLLLSEKESEDGPRTCQLCSKKEERMRALRRAIGDDHERETVSPRSPAGLTRTSDPVEVCLPSLDSPSSPANSDRRHFDQTSHRQTPTDQHGHSIDQHGQSNGRSRLAPPSSQSPAGHSVSRHSGHSSPCNNPAGQHQALIQKLQGALSKMTPRMFKTTKSERPLSAVGAQDQKIFALMLAKKEEEERQRNLRELSHHQWEEEMRMAKDAAATSFNRAASLRRRRNTGDSGSRRHKDKSTGEMPSENGEGSDSQTPCSAHGTHHSTTSLEDKGKSRLDAMQQKSREKQIQAMERKKSVEQRLEQKRREMEEHQLQLKRKQEHDLERANSVRISREQQQTLRAKLKNLQAQQKQEKIVQMKRQSMVDLSQKQEEMRSKLNKAELKVHQQRQEEARRKRDDLERRIEQSRLRQEHMEVEQSNWQEELLKYQKWKDYQADGLARENLAKKREAACAERIQREALQRENMKRLLNQEDQWLNDVEATIAMKEARIRTVQKDKEEQIQRSRAMASASQRMREELKTHYSMNDLDQVTRQVILENRLVSRGAVPNQPPSHNSSTLNLGGGEEF